jgi:predicted signal transduction protein with EAL and GGDEF domain
MIERASWVLLALVHLTPALALFAPSLLTRLYGVKTGDPLFLLMHHRAALFLAVVIACIWCAIDPTPRKLGVIVVAISMVSFLALYVTNGSPTALRQIAIADLIGLPALAYVAWRAFGAN